MMSKKTNFLVIGFCLLIISSCSKNTKRAISQDNNLSESIKVAIEKEQNDISVTPSHKKLTVNNPHGNIYIRKTEEPFVGVFSTMQLIGEDAEEAKINIENNSKNIKIDISYSSDKTIGVNTLINGHKKGRVDLVVYVPKQLIIKLKTTYGSINVKRIDNEVDLSTTSGSVKLSSRGRLNIETVSGDVYAYLIEPKWNKKSKIISDSGNLIITFPELSSLDLKVSSKNSILSNFNLESTLKNDSHIFENESKKNPLSISNLTGQIKLVEIKKHKVQFSQEEKTP